MAQVRVHGLFAPWPLQPQRPGGPFRPQPVPRFAHFAATAKEDAHEAALRLFGARFLVIPDHHDLPEDGSGWRRPLLASKVPQRGKALHDASEYREALLCLQGKKSQKELASMGQGLLRADPAHGEGALFQTSSSLRLQEIRRQPCDTESRIPEDHQPIRLQPKQRLSFVNSQPHQGLKIGDMGRRFTGIEFQDKGDPVQRSGDPRIREAGNKQKREHHP